MCSGRLVSGRPFALKGNKGLLFETERLVVCDWQPSLVGPGRPQLDDAVGRILTPAVLAALPPAAQDLSKGVAFWIDRQATHARGLTVCDRQTGYVIGLGLLMEADNAAVNVGYLFDESVWGQGIASEMLSGLINHLRHSGVRQLFAGVAQDNLASARVLTKCGFVALDSQQNDQTLHFQMDLHSAGQQNMSCP